MPHFKDPKGGLHFIEDRSYTNLLPAGSEEITDAEAFCVNVVAQPLTYSQLRRFEYPSIEDQLDMLYHDSVNKTSVWKDTISAVKTKIPKI